MKILDILAVDSIVPELKGKTKKQVLEELIDAVKQKKPHLDRDRFMKVLLERERLGSTGIGDGIAIPHGKLSDIDDLALSFGRSTEGNITLRHVRGPRSRRCATRAVASPRRSRRHRSPASRLNRRQSAFCGTAELAVRRRR
jgi:mannitol/fructose-specific phosphotransferase system IIA component (Ntr-type)